jgi:dihydrofolate reductase
MSRIYVMNHVTLDGVMQAPGRPDEDTRDNFAFGGWSSAGMDEVLMGATYARASEAGGLRLLLGRRSYEGMLGYWNAPDSLQRPGAQSFREGLNAAPKYVASTALHEPLPWPNSTLLNRDVAEAVLALKREPGTDLCVMGSGELIQVLLRHGLIDEFTLFIHPRVLGSGRRLFPSGTAPSSFHLVESRANSKGVMIARYQLAASQAGSR